MVLFSIPGGLLFQPFLVIDAKAFTPGGTVVVAVHDHGAGGQVAGDGVAVFVTPTLQRRVRRFGSVAEILQVQGLRDGAPGDERADEGRDDDDGVARGIFQEGFFECWVLVDFL